jgi:hypothetical protein
VSQNDEREAPMSLEVALDFADHPRPYHTLQAPADTNGELYRALTTLAAAYRAALANQRAEVPGWKLVPVEPRELAESLYAQHPTYRGTRPVPWRDVSKDVQREWLDKARAALAGKEQS